MFANVKKLFRDNLRACFAVVFGIQLMVGTVVYRSIQEFVQDAAWVTHTHEVLKALSETLGELVIAESAMRGYVVTAQKEYLDNYYEAAYGLGKEVDKVKRLIGNDTKQRANVLQLETQIRERFAGMEHVIVLRQRSFEAALGIALTGLGKQKTDAIRALISAMEAQETSMLAQRRTAAQYSARMTLWLAVSGVTLSLTLLIFMSVIIWRENRRRVQVETELRESNANLNHSVAELQRMTREMALLNAMGEMLQRCRSTDDAYRIIDRTMARLLPNVGGILSLVNGAPDHVGITLQWGKRAGQTQFAPQDCWALRQGRVYSASDAIWDAGCGHACAQCDQGTAADAPAQSLSSICTPLMAYGETLGVLSLTSRDVLTGDEERVARIAAEQISLSLANLKLLEKLRAESIRDPLSGLFNRRYMAEALERELTRAKRRSHPVSVIMVDIDYFKKFNDSYGHDSGDALLEKFAGLLKKYLRAEDISCRYGGEEFVLIMPEAPLAIAQERAERLREQTKQLGFLETVTASFGIAVFPEHGSDGGEIIRASDAALYAAKRAGRDCVVVAKAPNEWGTAPIQQASRALS